MAAPCSVTTRSEERCAASASQKTKCRAATTPFASHNTKSYLYLPDMINVRLDAAGGHAQVLNFSGREQQRLLAGRYGGGDLPALPGHSGLSDDPEDDGIDLHLACRPIPPCTPRQAPPNPTISPAPLPPRVVLQQPGLRQLGRSCGTQLA